MDQYPLEPGAPLLQRLHGLRRGMSWQRTFAALKYKNYKLWFVGQMVSLFGSWMQVTAEGFLIYELTKSPAYLGLVGFAAGLPTWIFMLYAGVVADRIPRRRLLILTQSAMMIPAFILAGLSFLHLVQPWHILVLAFIMGIANAFDAPARQAFILEMVEVEDMTNAIALNSAMFNMGTAIGPAAAGVTYALFGPAWCFIVNGISYLAVIAALAMMKLKPVIPCAARKSVFHDLKTGIGYVVHRPMILFLILTMGMVSFFGLSFATLVPAWAVKILGGNATTNGFLQSARGLGALFGALLIASLGHFRFRGKLLAAGTFGFPALLIVFSFVRSLPVSLCILVAAGSAMIMVFNLCNSLVQSFAPQELRGRIMAIYSFVFFGFTPLGSLWIGGLAAKIGEPTAIAIGGAISLLYALAIWVFVPELRRLA